MTGPSNPSERRLRAFLCHSSADKAAVRELYRRLKQDGFDPWLDEVNLVPGQAWREAIEDAVRASDAVIVCLSQGSVNKEGFLQKEIKFALDVADEKPEGTIFIIPARLEEVEIPRRLRDLQSANLYQPVGYEQLVLALRTRAQKIPAIVPSPPPAPILPTFVRQEERGVTIAQALRDWVRAHLPLATVLAAVAGALVVGGVYGVTKLSRVEKQRRLEAAATYTDALEKLREFETQPAEELLQKAVGTDPQNALAYAALALTLSQRGHGTRAQTEAQTAFDLRHSLNARDQTWVEGVYNEINRRWDPAITAYRALWTQYRDPEAGLRLSEVQISAGKAVDVLSTTVPELLKLPSAAADPRIEYEEALATNSLGNFGQEVEAAERMARKSPEGSLLLATALNQQCWALYKRNADDDMKNAEGACSQAQKLFRDNGDQLGVARSLTRHSLILDYQDPQSQQALTDQEEALSIAHKLNAEFDEAGALQNLGGLWADRKQPDKATESYDKAIAILSKLGNQRYLANAENDKATMLSDLCRYQDARKGFEQAGQAAKAAGSQDGVAIATANVGAMLYLLGDLKGSRQNLEAALRLAASLDLQLGTANWLLNLGQVFMAEDKLEQAKRCYTGDKCYEESAGPNPASDDKFLPEGRLEFALLLVEEGQPAQLMHAESLARLELAESKKNDDTDREAASLDVLARALIARGDSDSLRRASDATLAAGTLTYSGCPQHASLAITTARTLARLRRFEQAQNSLQDARRQANDHKLVGYQFEAELAGAEIESLMKQTDSARSQAADLSRRAGDAGFTLIAKKASAIASQTEWSQPR